MAVTAKRTVRLRLACWARGGSVGAACNGFCRRRTSILLTRSFLKNTVSAGTSLPLRSFFLRFSILGSLLRACCWRHCGVNAGAGALRRSIAAVWRRRGRQCVCGADGSTERNVRGMPAASTPSTPPALRVHAAPLGLHAAPGQHRCRATAARGGGWRFLLQLSWPSAGREPVRAAWRRGEN